MTLASGAVPDTSALYAPYIKRRKCAAGAPTRYFVVPERDVKSGYLPKTRPIPAHLTEHQAAEVCRKWYAELVAWRTSVNVQPISYTVGWLIDRYLNDDFSPFRKLREKSRRSYQQNCTIIKATKGRVPLAMIKGPDVLRWHDEWGHPVPVLGNDGKQVIDAWKIPSPKPAPRSAHAMPSSCCASWPRTPS